MKLSAQLLIITSISLIISTYFIFPPEKSFATTIYEDQFTAPDNTSLNSYNPKYIPVQSDNAIIFNNRVTGHASPYYYNDFGTTRDESVSYDFMSDLSRPIAYEQWTRVSNDAKLEIKLVINVDGSGRLDFFDGSPFYTLTTFSPGFFHDSTYYNLRTTVVGSLLSVYIDGVLKYSVTVPLEILYGTFGFNLYNENNYFDNSFSAIIDNLVFDQLSSQNYLNVPLLKQTTNPWQSQVYDSANKWNPSAPTINTWGCALTSAAMVFNYYGINKLPDGTTLDPGTLNTWLKNQKDGYIGQGLINWLALTRLSKLSKNINSLAFDALEYKRKSGNTAQLTNDINSGIPDILKEPGHYIVAKGVNGGTFDINDPYYNRNTLDDSYNNSFQNIGSFTKSNTDLSYIMLVIDPSINLTVTDSNSNIVGESFTEGPIINPEDSSQSNSYLKIYYIPKPPDDTYTISLSSNTSTNYSLGIYLYDTNGNVKINNISGNVRTNENVSYNINYKDKLLTDLNKFLSEGSIDNQGIYESLVTKVDASSNFLNKFLNELNAQEDKHINRDAYNILLNDLGL